MTDQDKKIAKVLKFPGNKEALDSHSLLMLKVADEIDAVILNHIGDKLSARDLAGLLAHRLGTLMRHIDQEDREVLWLVVQKVLREQADLDKAEDL